MKEICSFPVGQRMQKAYHDLVWTQSKDAQQIQATPLKKVKKEAVIKQYLTSMFFHTSHTNESQNTRVTYFPKYRCATVSANLAAILKCFSKGLIDFHY